MPRPFCRRRIGWIPRISCFYPGVQTSGFTRLEKIILTMDEFEAIRLADFIGLYHEEAAEQMGISRQTFGRIIESARKKVAEFLINGKMLCVEGGPIEMVVSSPSAAETSFSNSLTYPPFPFLGSLCLRAGQIISHKHRGHKIHHGGRGSWTSKLGSEDFCLCPKCGFRRSNQLGVLCIEERCPNCGSPLIREGSEHHRQTEEKIKSEKEKKGGE